LIFFSLSLDCFGRPNKHHKLERFLSTSQKRKVRGVECLYNRLGVFVIARLVESDVCTCGDKALLQVLSLY